jgi:carboxypeptidase C (cathepsin A)
MKKLILAAMVGALAISAPLLADEKGKVSTAIPTPKQFITKHTGTFGGKKLSYTATAGDTYLRDKKGKPTATIFNYAYVKNDVKDTRERPVTFIFNGGPGSPSMWLHMGVFGPKLVKVPSEADADDGAAPYDIVDNVETLLDVSDLVFIDPVGTGMSRPFGDHGKEHWGLIQDATSVSEFIRTWVDENNRWNSPKFIAGESYGTPRAAVMSDILTNRMSVSINGIVLISAVLDYQNSRQQHGGLMYYVSMLPTMAATAYYHNALPNKPDDLEAFMAEVRDFGLNQYLTALAQGQRLSSERRQAIVDKLHAFTGLKKSFIEDSDMRITTNRFYKELLRDRGQTVGRIDSRYLGTDMENAGERYETDPFMYSVGNAFNVAINDHLQNFLSVPKQNDRIYNLSGRMVDGFKWDWRVGGARPNGGRYVNTIPYLGRAMRRNTDMKILVPSGYYDFATPFFGAENALAERGIPQDRVEFSYFEAGHMMYLQDESRTRFLNEIREFIRTGY